MSEPRERVRAVAMPLPRSPRSARRLPRIRGRIKMETVGRRRRNPISGGPLRRRSTRGFYCGVIVGVLIAATTASTAPAAYHGQVFHTPTNNIRCDGDATHIECWVMSTAGRNCEGRGYPHAWLLHPRGRAWTGVPCDGPGTGPALRYGSLWSAGASRCRSRFTGLTCWSTISRHGFFLSRERQRRF
jgi:hypothetical protein